MSPVLEPIENDWVKLTLKRAAPAGGLNVNVKLVLLNA